MTRLDTIELVTQSEFIRGIDMSNFTVSKIIKPNGLKIINLSLNTKKLGVEKIIVNETFGKVKIRANSKILKENYIQGININSWGQFIDEINSTGIKLNNDFTENCTVNKIDVKNDLKLKNEIDGYINTLNHLIAPKFTKTLYKTGIVFNENIIKNSIRLTGYLKGYEMQMNKVFYNSYPQIRNEFDNILRIESRFSSIGTIKKYLGSNNIVEVLNSTSINKSILNRIINNQTKFKPVFNTIKMTNSEEKNFAQVHYLNTLYNGDFDSIVKHIKDKLGKNTKATYQRNQVKKYLSMINNANDSLMKNNIDELLFNLSENE